MSEPSGGKPEYLSHLKAVTRIKDPIHKTITLTCFDREVVDSRYYQRLHFVLQNSTTYAAYPSNKNTRFIHSLGVSEVAGQLFVSSVNSADPTHLQSFLEDFASFFENHFAHASALTGKRDAYYNKIIEGWKQTIAGKSGFSHSPHIYGITKNSAPSLFANQTIGKVFPAGLLVDTLWQAVRICGLAHDIGHLPMSHSFELAMENCPNLFEIYAGSEDFPDQQSLSKQFSKWTLFRTGNVSIGEYTEHIARISGRTEQSILKYLDTLPIHERRSLFILSRIEDDNRFEFSENDTVFAYRRLIYWIAFFILYSSSMDRLPVKEGRQQKPAVDGLGKIATSSELSFLRVLKTIVASELDADRMDYTIRDGHACGSSIGRFDLDRLVQNAVLVKRRRKFHIAYYERAISGIEQFFNQRRDSYKYLIYHRTSSRTEACLQELISRIFHHAFTFPRSPVADILVRHSFIKRNENNEVEGVLPFDEFAIIAQDDSSLRSLLFDVMRAIDEMSDGDAAANRALCGPIRSLSDIVLVREFKDIFSPFKHSNLQNRLHQNFPKEVSFDDIRKATSCLMQGQTLLEYEIRLKRDIAANFPDVTTVVNYQFPKGFNRQKVNSSDAIFLMSHDAKLKDIADCSSTLRSLEESSSSDKLTINVYFVSEDLKKYPGKMRKLDELLLERLKVYFSEILNKSKKKPKRRGK